MFLYFYHKWNIFDACTVAMTGKSSTIGVDVKMAMIWSEYIFDYDV